MKTVIEMARSVGARPQQNKNCDVEYLMSTEALEAFAELARAAEREACALLIDEQAQESNGPTQLVLQAIAEAIRARS